MNIQQQKQFKVLLIGDSCKDIYQYGYVDRISPEAPVPVFVKTKSQTKYGMVENVAINLFALNCDVQVIKGEESTKTRLIDSRSKQQIVRVDEDVYSKTLSYKKHNLTDYDAIVVSDYDKGSVSSELIVDLRKDYIGPIFIDTKKKDLVKFEGCFVKINELEYNHIESECSDLIVTLGHRGAQYKNIIYPAKQVEVSDVCGAGDTFLASLTFKYLQTKNIEQAIQFAINASSVTVQHLGVYAPSLDEICD
jgi:D-beta-D-heptose 7-phosphate kinase/D-beta-D-heptose 1-phosphate adenosyltransferase